MKRPLLRSSAFIRRAGGLLKKNPQLSSDLQSTLDLLATEIHDLIPEAECAEVKSGVSRTAGFMLSHPAACALIREKAQRAMQRLAEFRPYRIAGPVEVRVEFTTAAGTRFEPREGVERVNERTWVFRGKDIMDAWLKYGSF